MDLLFNELSYQPLASSFQDAENRFDKLLKTFKESNSKFGFKKIQFHEECFEALILEDKKFIDVINSISNSTLKVGILTFIKKPFIEDLEEEELEEFLESKYKISNEDVSNEKEPSAIPIAHIKSTMTISFDSAVHWRNRKIEVLKTNEAEDENLIFFGYNICLPEDLETDEILEWKEKVFSNEIDDKEKLKLYLSYDKYDLDFKDDFMEQLMEWKLNENKVYKRILMLMKDVELHPFTGGIGKTENLKGKGKESSKRITDKDRLSYTLEKDVTKYVACKGHYQFH